MDTDLFPVIWFGLIAFALILYVVLDGFSLGIGILFPFISEEKQRDIMMTTISPFWDGNQTWLVFAAAGLYGAFPLAYATILPAMYLPLILMLICLFFRGMAFEFRFKTPTRRWYDWGFSGTAIVATFIQGMIVGSMIYGIEVEDGHYVGGPLDWFSWFGMFSGVALVMGYAVLGAAWLITKTEGRLQKRCYRLLRPLLLLFMLSMFVVVIWTPLANQRIGERWLSFPALPWLCLVAVVIGAMAFNIIRGIGKRHEKLIFTQLIGIFILGLIGLVFSLFPIIIPPDITIWQAASHRSSQLFMMVGYVLLIPLILAYTAFGYRVFRGKVRESEG
ncbi:cytochrome d ubiquinol oxidase subunit II [Phytohalomonas tamaricis]|uniref:cytochrome d ubiquinol oxidase subunit II n=1 Tax=Phytohalomonas tamaricis TaxID=2081032 RepID=UPI000D0BC0E9|nr:cytochrome d ubiquinol oxidase subunit II [Phytohalomonas tamaricis]